MSKKAEIIYGSFKGVSHQKNEDERLIIFDKNYSIITIFDGVSTAAGSGEGIKLVKDYLKKQHKYYYRNDNFNLSKLFYDSNKALISNNISEPFTTFCSLFIPLNENDKIKYVSLGDSRIYSISNQYIDPLTYDDKNPLQNNVITKYLGKPSLQLDEFKQNDLNTIENMYLLCTDGFYALMDNSKERFFEIFNFSHLENMKKAIKREIKNNIDDASYIIVRINV